MPLFQTCHQLEIANPLDWKGTGCVELPPDMSTHAPPAYSHLKPGRLDDPEVKDVDFCPHTAAAAILQQQQQQQPSGAELLATVGGNGVCRVWEVRANQQQLVATLEPPKGMCELRSCVWQSACCVL